MELQHIAVFNGVVDGVGVQLPLKNILGGLVAGFFALYLYVAGVLVKDGGASKAEQLRIREKLLDGSMVLAKLRAVALVKKYLISD